MRMRDPRTQRKMKGAERVNGWGGSEAEPAVAEAEIEADGEAEVLEPVEEGELVLALADFVSEAAVIDTADALPVLLEVTADEAMVVLRSGVTEANVVSAVVAVVGAAVVADSVVSGLVVGSEVGAEVVAAKTLSVSVPLMTCAVVCPAIAESSGGGRVLVGDTMTACPPCPIMIGWLICSGWGLFIAA